MSRILLVDDDIAEISAVKRVLSRAGHQPVLATNASDAAAAIGRERPALLIVSATCESGEALALARRLVEDPSAASIPLIVLGQGDPLPTGARPVPRPVDPEQLQAEVKAALGVEGAIPAPAAPSQTGSASAARMPPPAPRPHAGPARPAAARPSGLAGRNAAPASPGARPPDAPGPRREPAVRRAPPSPGQSGEPPAQGEPEGESAPPRAVPAGGPSTPAPAGPAASPATSQAVAHDPDARRAAADALRARAEELRRGGGATAPRAEPPVRQPVAPLSRAPDLEGGEPSPHRLDARERARGTDGAERSGEPLGLEDEASAQGRGGSEAQENARCETEEAAQREAEQSAAAEAEAHARREAEEALRREAEQIAHREAEEARRARGAEQRAASEAEARRRAEDELAQLREQLEQERKSADQRLASVMERAAAEEEAAEEIRRMAEDETRRRAEEDARSREEEEGKLRTAITSARAEMEALRKRGEEEARRRAEAEAELRRVTESARRPASPQAPPAAFTPPPFFAPFDEPEPSGAIDEAPPPDLAEEAARRRVAGLRAGRDPEEAAPPEQVDLEPRPLPPPPAELREGNLADLPPPRLLALAARSGLTGRLDFQGDAARSIWFEDGRAVGAASADPAERVEELALRLGLVTRDQHRQVAQAAASLPSRRAALLLLERGFLKPTELTGLVRRRTEEVVFGVFSDPGARFRWAASEVPAEERIALERTTLALAIEGVRRRWRAPRVDALLGGPGTLLAPAPGAPPAAELGLSAEERRAVALADGLRTLDEVVHASPLDTLTTRQVLAALILVGALSVRLLQAGRPQGAAAAAIDLARVRDKLDQARRADYFAVLGLGRLCTPHEVREASERLAAEFDPRRYHGVKEDGLPAKLSEILQVVQDAREVLADDRLREEYLRGLGVSPS